MPSTRRNLKISIKYPINTSWNWLPSYYVTSQAKYFTTSPSTSRHLIRFYFKPAKPNSTVLQCGTVLQRGTVQQSVFVWTPAITATSTILGSANTSYRLQAIEEYLRAMFIFTSLHCEHTIHHMALTCPSHVANKGNRASWCSVITTPHLKMPNRNGATRVRAEQPLWCQMESIRHKTLIAI